MSEIKDAIKFLELKAEYKRCGLDVDKYDQMESMEDKAYLYYQMALNALTNGEYSRG